MGGWGGGLRRAIQSVSGRLALKPMPVDHFTHGRIGTHGLPSGSGDGTVDGALWTPTLPTELVVVGDSSGISTWPTELVVDDGSSSLPATNRVSSTSTTSVVGVSSIGMQPAIRRNKIRAPGMLLATTERPAPSRRYRWLDMDLHLRTSTVSDPRLTIRSRSVGRKALRNYIDRSERCVDRHAYRM